MIAYVVGEAERQLLSSGNARVRVSGGHALRICDYCAGIGRDGMGEGFLIREAGHDDLDRIVELWAGLLDYHLGFDPKYERTADSESTFAAHLGGKIGDADHMLLVVEVDGEVVGFTNGNLASYPPILAHRAHGYLDNMVISSEHRRRGLGAALLEAAMGWFRAKGVPTVEARVHLANPMMMAFLRKTEFAPYMQMIRAPTKLPE